MIKKYVSSIILLFHFNGYAILATGSLSPHLEKRIRILAKKMNIQRPFEIFNGERYASLFNSIFINELELNKLPKEEQNMIICHELSHLSSYHSEKNLAFIGCMCSATAVNSLQLQRPCSKYKVLSFLAIQTALTTGSYYGFRKLKHASEYAADKKAYEYLNDSTGFLYFFKKNLLTSSSSFSHPSNCERLQKILEYDRNNIHAKQRPQDLVRSISDMIEKHRQKKSRD